MCSLLSAAFLYYALDFLNVLNIMYKYLKIRISFGETEFRFLKETMLNLSSVDRIWNLRLLHEENIHDLSSSSIFPYWKQGLSVGFPGHLSVMCSFSFNEIDFLFGLSFWKARFAVQAMNRCRGTSSFVFKRAASSIDWSSKRLLLA